MTISNPNVTGEPADPDDEQDEKRGPQLDLDSDSMEEKDPVEKNDPTDFDNDDFDDDFDDDFEEEVEDDEFADEDEFPIEIPD